MHYDAVFDVTNKIKTYKLRPGTTLAQNVRILHTYARAASTARITDSDRGRCTAVNEPDKNGLAVYVVEEVIHSKDGGRAASSSCVRLATSSKSANGRL